MKKLKTLLIGQVFVDISIANNSNKKLRLGGIVHSARTFWAIKEKYSAAYFSPQYLDSNVEKYLTGLDCFDTIKIGNVFGCPNIQLIENTQETGEQVYEDLLVEERILEYDLENFKKLLKQNPFDRVLVFPGGFNLDQILKILSQTKAEVILDINYIDDLESLFINYGRKFHTLILSTSSRFFLELNKGNVEKVIERIKTFTNHFIFKENRGGSFFINFLTNKKIDVQSYPRKIVHSVGVGDSYDAVYSALYNENDEMYCLNLCSLIASEYAATTYPDDFNKAANGVLQISKDEIISLKGIRLNFTDRKKIHIYLAAPDFDYMNTFHISQIDKSLLYHNFSPHRPIKENGQATKSSSINEKSKLLEADLDLLNRCQILIAVLLNNDPGTLIEIGIAIERRIPVIVFDPYKIAENLFLCGLPDLITSDLDEIITEIFRQSERIINGNK